MIDATVFWSRVDRSTPSVCWEWTGARTKAGYGEFSHLGRVTYAHRHAFLLTHGKLPKVVMHKCDNPACCNPSHLEAGDHAKNNADKAKKMRGGVAKLNPAKVRAIRASSASGPVLAGRYGVSISTISNVRLGKVWRHA